MHKLVKYLYNFEALAQSFTNKHVQSKLFGECSGFSSDRIKLFGIYWLTIFEPYIVSKSIAV